MLEFILNIVLIAILILTIAFCLRLELRINQLKSGKNNITSALQNLDNTLISAQQSILTLKEMHNALHDELLQQNKVSREMLDDLRFIVDKGNLVADKLEQSISNSRLAADLLDSSLKNAGSEKRKNKKISATKKRNTQKTTNS